MIDWNVWATAYGQVFLSLNLAFSVIIACVSYLPKKSDIITNAFIIAFAMFKTLVHMFLETELKTLEII